MTDCIHYKVAEREISRLTGELLRETDPEAREDIRALRNAQAKQMDAHRNCRCQELRESA